VQELHYFCYLNIGLRRKKIFNCVICGKYSFDVICDTCKTLIKPEFRKKNDIISFYDYEEIEKLIKYKYYKFGHRVLKILAEESFFKFFSLYPDKLNIIPIDDNPAKGFSHTAVLANAIKGHNILYSTLHSQNKVHYAGKDLEFRLNNPKDFKYTGAENIDVVLIDDVLTTGSTINEAKEVLKKYNVNVLFSVVLANLQY